MPMDRYPNSVVDKGEPAISSLAILDGLVSSEAVRSAENEIAATDNPGGQRKRIVSRRGDT